MKAEGSDTKLAIYVKEGCAAIEESYCWVYWKRHHGNWQVVLFFIFVSFVLEFNRLFAKLLTN